jgi:hypothetical protein
VRTYLPRPSVDMLTASPRSRSIGPTPGCRG